MTSRPPKSSPGETLLDSIAGYFGIVVRSRDGLRALDARIDALRARADAAEARVVDAEGALTEARSHHERDRAEGERQLHDARGALERAMGEARAARVEAERAAAEGGRLRAQIEAARTASEEALVRLAAERDRAASQLADQLANRDRLEAELAATRAGYEARVALLETDIARIRDGAAFRLRDASAELARSREATADLAGRMAAVERERDDMARALEGERREARERLEALERSLADMEGVLAVAREEALAAMSRLGESRQAHERVEAEFAAERRETEAALSRLRSDVEAARSEFALAQARLQDQYANRDRLEAELVQTRAGYEDRIRKSEAALTALGEEARGLRQSLAASSAQADEAEKASHEAATAELERQRSETRRRIAEIESEREILRIKLAERIEEARNKDEARAAIEGRRDVLAAELAKAQEAAARLATLEAERRRLIEERDAAQAALVAARAAAGTVEEPRRAQEQQARALQSAKDELAAENLRLRAQLDAMRLPSILVVSLVKSGTVFTRQSLSLGLGVEAEPVGFGYFPRYLVELPKLIAFRESGRVGYSHLDASEVNVGVLASQLSKWVVHVRDPRSILVSWVHHLKRLHDERHNEQHQLLLQENPPPEEYHGWSFPERMDWNIRNFLPDVVRWTKDWLVAVDGGRAEILLTNYRDLARSPEAHIHGILDFYGVPRARWRRPVIEKTIQASHFRRGLEDEWKEALTPAQLARANAAIGADLLERFQWERGTTRRVRH